MGQHSKSAGLTKGQLQSLNKDGYLGPLSAVVPNNQVTSIAKKLLGHVRNRGDRNPLYGRYSVRDWHLVYPELLDFVTHPAVLNQLKAIMGDDLILWRSHVFYKPPGTGPVGWHQEFGSFSGEDIGNNKPSLVPTHLPNINERVLKEYLPSSTLLAVPEAAPDLSDFWDMTVWVALTDIEADMGVLKFLPGSHKQRYPIRMEPLPESDFWQEPFVNLSTKAELVSACKDSQLVLDIDTSRILEGVPVDNCSYVELKQIVLSELAKLRGSRTVVNEVDEAGMVTFPTAKGEYLLFSERVLHGSLANTSDRERLAINFRVTPSTTLVYPSRTRGDFTDGFNLDVSQHENILLSGRDLNPDNVTRSLSARPAS